VAEPGVVIPIEGDASGLQAAIATASASLRSLSAQAAAAAAGGMRTLETASDKAGTSAKKAATATEKYKDAAYALNKAANATGGALTFLTGPLEDVGDLLEKGGGRMAAMAIGATAAVGAMYAVGRGALAAADALYQTAANASELIGKLEDAGRTVLPAHREALLEAERATTGLKDASLGLQLTLAGEFSGTLTNVVDTVSGLTTGIQTVITEMSNWATEIDATFDALFPMYKTVSLLASGLGALIDVTAESGKANREQAAATVAVADANAAWMKGLEEHFKKEDELTKKVDAGTTARRERTIAIRQEKEAILDLAATQLDLSEFTNPDDMSANAGQSRLAAQNREEAESYALRTDAQNAATDALRAENEQVAKNKKEWGSYFDDLDERAQVWADNTRYYSNIVFQTATNLNDALTKNARKAARNRAIIHKAAAIVEASINVLLGVTKALGSASPPVNFVLAGIVGAIGAVNVGLIAAKPLVYHRGGMLDPDEERLSQTSTVVRRNESLGIVTSAGRSATTTAVSRLNAGEVSAGDTYLMIEGDVFRTRRVGGPDPGYGRKRGVTGGR
jgi:hypothetical protein